MSTKKEEEAYERGVRAIHMSVLRRHLIELGYSKSMDDPVATVAFLTLEREQLIAALRAVCKDFGDNEWTPDHNMADVVEKHLSDKIRDQLESIADLFGPVPDNVTLGYISRVALECMRQLRRAGGGNVS